MTINGRIVELTEPEKRCLKAYRIARKLAGMNPTTQEVGNQMGHTRASAALLMKALVAKGILTQNGTNARCFGLPKRKAAVQ